MAERSRLARQALHALRANAAVAAAANGSRLRRRAAAAPTIARALAVTTAATVVLAVAPAAIAHPLAPALLELREAGAGRVDVKWRQSILKLPGANETRPVLPGHCKAAGPGRVVEDAESLTATWPLDCGERGLIGSSVGVDNLGGAMTDALVRAELADGRVVRAVVSARDPSFTIPARQTKAAVASSYAALGVTHILAGFDHLLFVLGLLLLVATRRQLLTTVTAFTVGHSVTLSLVALGVAAVPSRPVEVLIALSIYVLAVDLVRNPAAAPGTAGTTRAATSLLRRFPWAMALGFGLLHGMGFAGALGEAGLPAGEIPLALLSFNAGIEAGQLAFLLAVSILARAVRPLTSTLPSAIRRVPAYAMGSLAVLWMLERSAIF